MNESRRLRLAVGAMFASTFLLACSGFGAGGSPSPPPDEGAAADAGEVPKLPPVGGKPSARKTVNGTLVSGAASGSAPVALAMKVVLVDAAGVRQELLTNSEGRFLFADVELPYDLSTAPAVDAGSAVTNVFLGVSNVSPTLAVITNWSTHPGSSPGSSFSPVSLTLSAPTCPNAETCVVRVVSESAHGYGFYNTSYLPGTTTISMPFDHVFLGDALAEETVMYVVASTESKSAFWFRKLSTTLGDGVGALSLTTSLLPLPLVGKFKATLPDTSEGVPLLMVNAFLPGLRCPWVLGQAQNVRSLVTSVPDFPGMRIDVFGRVDFQPPEGTSYGGSRSIEASTGELPANSPGVDLSFSAKRDAMQPGPNGVLRSKTGQFSWQSAGAQTTALRVYSDQNVLQFQVFTNGQNISLQRLYDMGLPELAAGQHKVGLITSLRRDVDTSPPLEFEPAFGPMWCSRAKWFLDRTEYNFAVVP